MPEPFKNLFNVPVIRAMADHLARVDGNFDSEAFVAFATEGLDRLELKERASRLTDALERHLPQDFASAVHILCSALDPNPEDQHQPPQGIRGWPVMSMAEFIARRGQDPADVPMSLNALKDMTSRLTSEFAIRPFLIHHPQHTLATLHTWVLDDLDHVRRLVSEGTRPRLPWGLRLKNFVKDPDAVIALLEQLKDDPSEYVRRSVANNLNDIAKDHPDRIAEMAQTWMVGASKDRQRLIRHALRTLIKDGHPGAFKALGYDSAQIDMVRFNVTTPNVHLGRDLVFDLDITSKIKTEQALIIDYAIHHRRANGHTTAKVFKWKNIVLKGGASLSATKHHAFKQITTRRYYPGLQHVEILINAKSVAKADFELLPN